MAKKIPDAIKTQFPKGHRVQLHPGTDAWMMGARYGEIRGYVNSANDGALIRVKLDKMRKVREFHPRNLAEVFAPTPRGNPRKRNPVKNRTHSVQAISVKRLPATNTKGARYKATTASGISLTLNEDFELDAYPNAAKAAEALQEKLKWRGTLIGGSTADGWVFTFDSHAYGDGEFRNLNPRERGAKKNPAEAWVIALRVHGKRLTYDANRNRFTDNSKPALYRTMEAAQEKGGLLIQKYRHAIDRKGQELSIERATEKEAGAVFGARPRQRNPKGKGAKLPPSQLVTVHGFNKFETAQALASKGIPFLFRSETFAPTGLGGSSHARNYLSTTGRVPTDYMPEFRQWQSADNISVTYHPAKCRPKA